MTITALPPAPEPTDSVAVFNSRMFAFLAAMVVFQTELNTYATAYAQSIASTSTTSLTVGLGTQNLTVQTGKGYLPGMEVIIAYTTTPTVRMAGTVVTYNSGTGALEVSVTIIGTAGTHSAWTISPTTLASFNGQTFTSLVLAGSVTETPYALAGTSIDPANGTIQTKTLGANTTFTSAIADGQSVTLHLVKGAWTITWPTMKWLYGAPSLSSTDTSVVILWKVGSLLCGCYAGPLL